MYAIEDDYIIGVIKTKLGELIDRLDRERPELSQKDREVITVQLGRQEVAEALASRPELVERFVDMTAEHFLRAMASEVRSLRSA